MIVPKGWECPPPRPGELPVTIADAALATGHSKSSIVTRVRSGLLPHRTPVGCERPRLVYVSQVREVFGEVEG